MATKKRSTDQKNAAQALAGIKLYYDTAHIRSSPDSKVFNSTGYWEASKEYRTSREIYVAKTIKGATSVKVVAPVMTDETTAMKEDTSDPTNQITPVIPRAATFSAAAISYTVEDIQYVCIHGIELCPYPQVFLGLHATLSIDESLGMAKTTPVKDVIGADVKGGIKSSIATCYSKMQLASDDKRYASFSRRTYSRNRWT